MEESEIFENLMNVLAEYGEEVKRLYQARLLADDKKATGNLINHIEVPIAYKGTEIVVYLKMEDYWKYVEKGIAPAGKYGNPGWKAYPFIYDWVGIKPAFKGKFKLPGEKKDLPTQSQLAYLITRKIKDEGIKPGNQLEETLQAINNKYIPLLQEAIEKDFDKYALYVFKDINKMIRI